MRTTEFISQTDVWEPRSTYVRKMNVNHGIRMSEICMGTREYMSEKCKRPTAYKYQRDVWDPRNTCIAAGEFLTESSTLAFLGTRNIPVNIG